MSNDLLAVHQQDLRGTDSNSLLRIYDRVRAICNTSSSETERTRAAKALERIARELQRRKLSL
jgi:hypothetical protein